MPKKLSKIGQSLKSLFNRLTKYFDKLLPPIRFKKKYFEKLEPTAEDLDKWATEYLDKLERERRAKRAKHKN